LREAGNELKGQGVFPAGYSTINVAQQGISSGADNGTYLNFPITQPKSRYSNPSDVIQSKEGVQYNQVTLAQLNTEIYQHEKAHPPVNQHGATASQTTTGYLNLPGTQTKAHYSGPKDVPVVKYSDQFDTVSLAQLTNYTGVNLNRMHAGYNDIGT